MCPRGAGSGVGLELSTHPLADLHLSGTAHLALNSKMSMTESGRCCWPGGSGSCHGCWAHPWAPASRRAGMPCPPKNPLLGSCSQLSALISSDCSNHRSGWIKPPSAPCDRVCAITGSGGKLLALAGVEWHQCRSRWEMPPWVTGVTAGHWERPATVCQD